MESEQRDESSAQESAERVPARYLEIKPGTTKRQPVVSDGWMSFSSVGADCIEIGDRVSVGMSRKTLSDAAVKDWVRESSGAASMKLILGECLGSSPKGGGVENHNTVPFSMDTYTAIASRMRISGHFSTLLHQSSPQASKYLRLEPEPALIFNCKVGLFSTGYYCLHLYYSFHDHRTRALCLSQSSRLSHNGYLLPILRSPRSLSLSSQPMIIPLAIAEYAISICVIKLEDQTRRLNKSEDDLGQHSYKTRRKGDPMYVDFGIMTSSLNTTSTSLGLVEMRLRSLLLLFDEIKSFNRLMREFDSGGQAPVVSAARLPELNLDCLIERLSNDASNLILETSHEQKRTETQLAVVYSYVAQKDSKVNIQLATSSQRIAEEAKRDSSSMKTIAILTMLYLPSTFIAAFFAMPLFNWDAPPAQSVLKDRFWYFWATAMPLTLAVFLVWAAWEYSAVVRQILGGEHWARTSEVLSREDSNTSTLDSQMFLSETLDRGKPKDDGPAAKVRYAAKQEKRPQDEESGIS